MNIVKGGDEEKKRTKVVANKEKGKREKVGGVRKSDLLHITYVLP